MVGVVRGFGKSFLSLGFLRILVRDGVEVKVKVELFCGYWEFLFSEFLGVA